MMINRRGLLGMAGIPLTGFASQDKSAPEPMPDYHAVTRYRAEGKLGMPGRYPGKLVRVHSRRAIDEATEAIDAPTVAEMLRRGMLALTGESDPLRAWGQFISPEDVVGIKLNCSGAPAMCSQPEVVGEIAKNLTALGVVPQNIYLFERFANQVATVPYVKFLPRGTQIHVFEQARGGNLLYDPFTYVEVSFFGEEDARSNLGRIIGEKFTKIINVPNPKDHGASGVTGALKNIAYGSFSNVARSHQSHKTNTRTFIGELCRLEPLRSRTVLHIMDAMKGVWHGGPFSPSRQFRFYPKQLWFSTDPVAMDRVLLDLIEEKRQAEGAISVWDRSWENIEKKTDFRKDPNKNNYIREPGHIEYAAGLGLGIYDKRKLVVRQVEV